jgi:hypothetical protein
MSNTADVTGGSLSSSDRSLSQAQMLFILKSPFTTSMEERERCNSIILSRTPHETRPKKYFLSIITIYQFLNNLILLNDYSSSFIGNHHHHQLINIPMLGHRPSLWITHEENGAIPRHATQCGLVGAKDCKGNRDQRLIGPSEARHGNHYYQNIFL